jgi:predicted methyltransferase
MKPDLIKAWRKWAKELPDLINQWDEKAKTEALLTVRIALLSLTGSAQKKNAKESQKEFMEDLR